MKKGDRVSFLAFEVGIREGAGGTPGKKLCVFGRRRRYRGTVVDVRPGTWKEACEGLTLVTIRPDDGQAFDEAKERDGLNLQGKQTVQVIQSQSAIRPL